MWVMCGVFDGMILEPQESDEAKEEYEETNSDTEYERKEYEEEFQIEKREKKYQEMSFILGCLKNHFIFYNLSEAELANVAKKMFYCSVPEDQFIFKEGERAECFFIIEKGMMQVITKEKVKKQLRVGDGFGELALLYKAPRSVSVKAGENCGLWGIDRSTFRKAVEEIITLEYEENRKFMENVRFFSCLANQDKDSITAALIVQRFAKDQIVVMEGDPGSSFYIIKQGSASLIKNGKEIKKLHKGDSFGEQALYYNTIRQMSVKADEDVVCLVLGRETLTNILGDRIFIVTFRNFLKWCFEKHPIFSKLPKNQIENIIDEMKINYYKSGNTVIKKNSENHLHHKVIIVIEGALKRSKNSNPFVLKSQFYGEDYLHESRQKSSDDEILMDTDGILAEIPASTFKQIIGGYIDSVITKNQKIIIEKQNLQKMNKTKYFQELSEFILIKELREGVFGPVLLVQHINEKGIFVIKCYSRQKVEELFVEKYIVQEKNMMRDINFPFVMELYKTFKDTKNLYSLVEFIRGEELYDVVREIGLLSTEDCQFYAACMILILEQFYNNGIIYRDLKPENFIVDMQGYLKLCDLGTAKIIPLKGRNFQSLKTYTVIGTPYYMAPEIILAKGYNFTVDLYSLGVCMFEFLCGYVPFGEKADDPLKIYQEIVNGEVKYPKYLKDKKAKKLIDQFLCKSDPDNRLGGSSYTTLKSNSWFETINWQQLKEKQFKAPTFDRHPNISETDEELRKIAKVGINLEDFLNQKYPTRHQGEPKPYDNW